MKKSPIFFIAIMAVALLFSYAGLGLNMKDQTKEQKPASEQQKPDHPVAAVNEASAVRGSAWLNSTNFPQLLNTLSCPFYFVKPGC